ncbi:MAG: peptidyl-prolyl cis-trans isomerase [Cyclobacteriaceae bacterium]|nr:peptidyl-prolyl cis-trans isomerase [Cyclobacteriaceae bacterium]
MRTLKKTNSLLALFTLTVLCSCELLQVKKQDETKPPEKKPVARVHNAYLYETDLEGIVPEGTSKTDSAGRVAIYINNWVRKQLLIDEAKAKIDFDEADIQRKILDYRYSLIAYQYQAYYINQHLDKNVSEEEIQEYYNANLDNFPLKQNIIRGKYVKMASSVPKIGDVKKLIFSTQEKNKEKLQELCFGYAANYTLEDSVWINFDDLVKGSPFAEIPNTVQFLRNRKYAEASDDTYKYFLVITEYKKTDDIAPLDVVRDQIRDIIINKRKIALAKDLEKEVYNEAIKQNSFEIYR